MYQNCLRQQSHPATYIASPPAAAAPSPLLYDRGPYCYPRNSPPNPPQSTAVYQGSIYTHPNGHLAELTSPDCLSGARKPPVLGGIGLHGDGSSDPGSTSPIGTVYWTNYQRGSYPVAPAVSTPPTTYYDPNRRVMSPSGVQWSASDVQFGGHPTVNDGQSSVDGYTAYRASVGGGDLGYARSAAARGGGGGQEVLSAQIRHQQQQQQHPSAAVYAAAASHQTSLKVVSAESRSGPASAAAYQRSTPAGGGQRVSAGSSTAAAQGHAAPPFDWMRKHAYPSFPNSGKTRTKDKYRIVYTELQKVELEKEFLYNQYITIQRKAELALSIGLSDRQVKIWFQNRRAKDRKQKRKRTDTHHHGNHHQHPQPTTNTASSSSMKTSSSASAAAPASTTRNNTSLLSSSPSSSSLSSSSSSLVLKQEMMGMQCDEDAIKLESNFVDSIARPPVANGNSGYDVIPIC